MDNEQWPSSEDGSSSALLSSFESSEFTTPKRCISQPTMHALHDMRLSETLCDASIVFPDERHEMRVHRVILSSCSEYFRILFTTALPSDKHTVSIPGIERSAMVEVIQYAYLRQCDLNERNVYEVYAAADFLIIRSLTSYCARFLVDRLRPDNCVKIMLFGRQRLAELVYESAKLFIMKHFMKLISSHADALLQLPVDDVCLLLADEQLNVRDESTVWEFAVRWIDRDPANRAQHVLRLMKTVRLGLLNTEYFLENVKENPYVLAAEDTKSLIIESLTFLYDLEMISTKGIKEMKTPAIGLPRLPHEVIFTVGGWSEGLPQSIIETYDTRADRWVRIRNEDPHGPRAYYGAAFIGTQLYCIGGYDGVEHFHTCRRFDMVHKVWHEIAPMHFRRCYVSVVALDGLLYAMGGFDGNTRHNTVERYNPHTNQWTLVATMNSMRSDADACVLEGLIYITGGFDGHECLATVESYDPRTNQWSLLPQMLSRRSGVSCAALDGSVYVVGGFNGLTRLDTCERYDPIVRQWTACPSMYHRRSNFGLETIDGMLFAIGGYDGVSATAYVECYSPKSEEWYEATDLGRLRSAFRAVTVSDLPNVRDYLHANKENLLNELYQNRRAVLTGERIDEEVEEEDQEQQQEDEEPEAGSDTASSSEDVD
ncbi:kelch-like protein 10 [Anopheles darlingi]|uniref:kelch-like protein 10 n=1 Tax=Anopheles darlingi TaxID=43151 RepID=UPI0021001494|nr:kelch-like protein 10 [Anopheles darlingi]